MSDALNLLCDSRSTAGWDYILAKDGESLSQLPFVEQFSSEGVTRMANKSLFASLTSRLPRASAVNEAGGRAYKLEPKHPLAQVAATGSFGNAFYSTAETQLDEVLKLIDEVDDNQYLAKLAMYAREKAFMKDMPAALLVALSIRDPDIAEQLRIAQRLDHSLAPTWWMAVGG